jgi:hypothetical protein
MLANNKKNMQSYRIFVWEKAISYLNAKADMKIIRQHMELTEGLRLSRFSDVYSRFLMSLANRQAMSNTIGDVERLSTVFLEFNHLKTLDRYEENWEYLTISNE